MALGGMTVGELKNRMTVEELRGWKLYSDQFGPFSLGMRFELAIARAVQPFLKAGTSLRQLLIWPKVEEKEASIQDVMALLKSKKTERKNGNS